MARILPLLLLGSLLPLGLGLGACGGDTDTPEAAAPAPGPLAQALTAKKAAGAARMPAEVKELMARAGGELAASNLLAQALHEGATAPDFQLQDGTGKTIALADLRAAGPVVVTFYRGKW